MTDRERIEALEWRVAALEEALGLTYASPPEWRLTAYEARILGMLAKTQGCTTRQRIYAALYGDRDNPPYDKIIDVYIFRMRKRLRPHGIAIHNTWSEGWWLDADARAKIAA